METSLDDDRIRIQGRGDVHFFLMMWLAVEAKRGGSLFYPQNGFGEKKYGKAVIKMDDLG